MPLLDEVEALIGVPQNPIAEILLIGFACYVGVNLFTYAEYIAIALINAARGK